MLVNIDHISSQSRLDMQAVSKDFGGYPLPGRSWALGVRFHLDRKAGSP